MKKLIIAFLFLVLPLRASAVEPLTFALGVSLAVHGLVLAIPLFKKSDVDSDGNPKAGAKPLTVVLPAANSPAPASTVPAGWSQPVAGADPVPPHLSPTTMIYFATSKFPSFVACSGAFGYSPDAACNACTAGAERLVAGSSSGCKSPSTGQVLANLGSGTGCPYGYTMQSGSCTITNPADVKKPAGTTTLVRPVVPSAPTDSTNPVVKPDAQASDPLPENVNYGPDYIEITNPDGSTERVDFVPYQGTTGTNAAGKPQGTVDKITKTTPASDGSFTNVTTTDLMVDSSGAAVVQGQASQDYSGTGSSQGTNPNPDMNCPGCARESTQQKVLGKLGEIKVGQDVTNETLGQLKDNFDGVGVGAGNTPADMQSAANDALANVQAYTQGTGANSLTGQVNSIISSQIPSVNTSWIPSLLPGSAVACAPIPLTTSFNHGLLAGISGTGYLDICDKLDLARQVLGYLFGIATVIYIYYRFFRIL